MKPIIKFEKVSKRFGKQYVIDKLDFTIYEKEIVGFIGKSGCGKSTLLKVFAGYFPVDDGRVLFHDQEISARVIRKLIGFCTQDNSYYHELTVFENMRYYGKMYGLGGKALNKRIEELLKLVELTQAKNKLVLDLSGGMKRRLDFAISLLHDPPILILDEPTTGLDPVLRDSIFCLMHKINRLGKTILLISHHLDYMQRYCTRVAIMDKGKIPYQFSPRKIPKKLSPHNNLIEAFINLMGSKE